LSEDEGWGKRKVSEDRPSNLSVLNLKMHFAEVPAIEVSYKGNNSCP